MTLALLGLSAAPPALGVQLGAYYCPADPCDATSVETLDAYRSKFGAYPDVALNFRDLDQPFLYPGEGEEMRGRGITPMITLEPVAGEGEIPSAAIADGRYDAELSADARTAAAFSGRVLLRYAQEMNGSWFPRRSADPAAFVAAWIHIVKIFRASGADNVAFVWTPSVGVAGTEPIEPYFPGDAFVDYVGLDGYNWGSTRWQSFGQIFAEDYRRISELSERPFIIGETASAPGAGKAEWIRNAFGREIPRGFPRIAAVVWFSKDLSGEGQRDWRIETSPAAATAWSEIVAATPYGGTLPLAKLEARPHPAGDVKAASTSETPSFLETLVALLLEALRSLGGAG
jgi:Glycosyl hydrolase family 26